MCVCVCVCVCICVCVRTGTNPRRRVWRRSLKPTNTPFVAIARDDTLRRACEVVRKPAVVVVCMRLSVSVSQ